MASTMTAYPKHPGILLLRIVLLLSGFSCPVSVGAQESILYRTDSADLKTPLLYSENTLSNVDFGAGSNGNQMKVNLSYPYLDISLSEASRFSLETDENVTDHSAERWAQLFVFFGGSFVAIGSGALVLQGIESNNSGMRSLGIGGVLAGTLVGNIALIGLVVGATSDTLEQSRVDKNAIH